MRRLGMNRPLPAALLLTAAPLAAKAVERHKPMAN
jgi:hypothetical protein